MDTCADEMRKSESSEPEAELPLSEEFALLQKEYDAFMARKKKLEKRFGKRETRPPRRKEGSPEPERRDVPYLAMQAIDRFNAMSGEYLAESENPDLRGKEFVVEMKGVPVTWTPDPELFFRLDKQIRIHIAGIWKKTGPEGMIRPGVGEIKALATVLAGFLEKELATEEKQIVIDLKDQYY